MKYITAEVGKEKLSREFPCKWYIEEDSPDKEWVIASDILPDIQILFSFKEHKFNWEILQNGKELDNGFDIISLEKAIRDLKNSLKKWKKRFEWVKA
jgi:hypothetical protein